MQPRITLLELSPTGFGKMNGEKIKDVYGGFKLPSRASPLLHSILLRDGYQDVRTIDPNYNSIPGRLEPEDFERIISSDYLLLSAITRTIPQTKELALQYKKENPAGKVIVGGAHATFLPEECLDWADIVVRNEGDKTIPELIKKLEKDNKNCLLDAPLTEVRDSVGESRQYQQEHGFMKGGALILNAKGGLKAGVSNPRLQHNSLRGVKGISYKMDGEIVHEEMREPLTEEELSNLPPPFFEASVRKGQQVLTISTSRGCPFNCNFCAVTKLYGSKYRRRSNESIISELKTLAAEPQQYAFFIDDNFAGKTVATKDLLRRMIALGLNTKKYLVQLSVHAAFDPELLELLKKAGVFAAFVGVESINEETLKALNKKTTAERNKEAIKLFRAAGIWVHAMLMVGGDGDTQETLKETLSWAEDNCDSVQFFTPIPLPGTEFAQEMERENRILTRDYHLYDAQHVIIRPRNFSPHELQEAIIEMYRRFYSLGNIARTLRRSVRPFHKLAIDFYARGIIRSITSDLQTKKHLEFLKNC